MGNIDKEPWVRVSVNVPHYTAASTPSPLIPQGPLHSAAHTEVRNKYSPGE